MYESQGKTHETICSIFKDFQPRVVEVFEPHRGIWRSSRPLLFCTDPSAVSVLF